MDVHSMRLFTLIHLSEDQRSIHNAVVASFDEQIRLYLACARQLRRSLLPAGIELVVITNDAGRLRRVRSADDPSIVEIPFDLPVPSGIRFFSAHFKIDVFRYLGSLDDPYVGLIDADVLCVNPMPDSLRHAIRHGIPLYYDVTEQVAPAHGAATIVRDKQRLQREDSLGLWAGGEFVTGPPAFFRTLYAEAVDATPTYFAEFASFDHQSDEMPNSVAIERLVRRGTTIVDAGALAIIGRFWSARTLHRQKPLDAYREHFLLHLPADKAFLAALAPDRAAGRSFFRAYEAYLRRLRRTYPLMLIGRKVRALLRR
jgi:hypothetical protein